MQNYNLFLFFIFFYVHSSFVFDKKNSRYTFSDKETSLSLSFKEKNNFFSLNDKSILIIDKDFQKIDYSKKSACFFLKFITACEKYKIKKIIIPLEAYNDLFKNKETIKKELYLKYFFEIMGVDYLRHKENTGILFIKNIQMPKGFIIDPAYVLFDIVEDQSKFWFINKEDQSKIKFFFDKKNFIWKVVFLNKSQAEINGFKIISFFKNMYDEASIFQENMSCLLSLEIDSSSEDNKQAQIINLHELIKKENKINNENLFLKDKENNCIKDFLLLYNQDLIKKRHSLL